MAWSSFEKDKLIIEGFRDFLKKKEKFVGTYPASELTTIVNLISNLAKKLNIKVDTSAIVDEFEAILKAGKYNLQEQEDKIMIGGNVNLNLSLAPKLKNFMNTVAKQNPEGLKILLKALSRGAFDVSEYEPAASTGQTPTEEPKQTSRGIDYERYGATDATPEKRADNLVVKPSSTDVPDEEEAETDRIQPVPEPVPEPVSEPQATEEPLKIITKILGEKGVDEGKVSAFINDLRSMGVIKEIAPRTLKNSLRMNEVEWVEFSQKHSEVIEAISQLRGRSKKAKALQAQFKDALSGIIAREKMPNMPRRRRKKKSTAASKSKNDSTPAAETPAEPAPQAVPEPAPAPVPEPEEEKQLDISQIKENILEAWRDYYNKDLKEPRSFYAPATMPEVMKRVDGVIDAGNNEYGTIVRFADIRNSKNEPYNAFVVPMRKKEKISYIKKYYNIKNEDEMQRQVRVKDIEQLAQYIIFDIESVKADGRLAEKGELEVIGSENSENPQSPPKRKKKTAPPIQDQQAYEHGKRGKSMNRNGILRNTTVQNIDKAIDGLLDAKAGSDNEELRNKIDSYIRGLDEYEPPTKLEESLMLRWKTIAGIK